MTLFCDPQSGSCDLIPYFKRYIVPRSLLVTNILLPSGDVMFCGDRSRPGSGPGSDFIRVGIEVKKLDDVLKCLIDNRYTDEQLPKMIRDYDELWLLIIDEFKPEPSSGYLVKRRRSSSTSRGEHLARRRRGDGMWVPASYNDHNAQKYGTLVKWLGTIQRYMRDAGFNFSVWHVRDEDEAAQWCVAQYQWYNDKHFDQHKAMKGFSSAQDDRRVAKKVGEPRAPIFLPRDVKMRAKVFNGFVDVGYETAVALARHFKSIHEALNASQEVLAGVRVGRLVLGTKKAMKLYNQIRSVKGNENHRQVQRHERPAGDDRRTKRVRGAATRRARRR